MIKWWLALFNDSAEPNGFRSVTTPLLSCATFAGSLLYVLLLSGEWLRESGGGKTRGARACARAAVPVTFTLPHHALERRATAASWSISWVTFPTRVALLSGALCTSSRGGGVARRALNFFAICCRRRRHIARSRSTRV